jgi:hypothetical protein
MVYYGDGFTFANLLLIFEDFYIQEEVLRKIFGPKTDEGMNCIMRSFVICTLRQV